MAAFSLGLKICFSSAKFPADRLILHGAGKLQRELEFLCRIASWIEAKKPLQAAGSSRVSH